MSPGRHLFWTFVALAVLATPGFTAPVGVSTAYTGLNAVTSLAFDSQRNLYATLRSPVNTVVKIPAGGGTPFTFATGFSDPLGIVCDSQGNLFVTNYTGHRVDKVTPSGTRTVFATGVTSPSPIAIDPQDNLYVGEYFSQTVRKITPAGVVSSYGSSGLGIGSNGQTRRLTALCYEPDGRLLCGTNGPGDGTGPFPIRSLPPGGGVSSAVCVSSFPVTSILPGPMGVHYFAGYQYEVISRSVLPAVPVLYAGATNLPGFVDGDLTVARFGLPHGLALDTDGLIYIADTTNDAIRVLNDPFNGPTPAVPSSWGKVKALYP